MRWLAWPSLRRVTSGGNYIPEIDGLRFIAIVSVTLYHLGMMSMISSGRLLVPNQLNLGLLAIFQGDRGVSIFFCISGLILGLPFAEQRLRGGRRVRLGAYLWRRVTRLEPPYIVNLLIRFPLVVAVLHVPFRVAVRHLFASLFYLHGLIYAQMPLVHPASWSLEIEVQFYLLAPALAAVFFSRNRWFRRGALLGVMVLFCGVAAHFQVANQTRLNLSLINYLPLFLAGLLMADGFLLVLPDLPESWLWDIAAVPLWCAVFTVPNRLAIYLLPFAVLILFPAAFRGRLLRPFFRNPFVATVGGMCYSIYLTHSLVLQACYVVLFKLHRLDSFRSFYIAGLLLAVPATLLVGTTFFVLIERPCMDRNWPQKLAARLRPRSTLEIAG